MIDCQIQYLVILDHFVKWSNRCASLVEGNMKNISQIYFKFGLEIKEMSFKDISMFSSGGHFVWRGEAICAILGVSKQLQSYGLVAHGNSFFKNLAPAVSGPFMV